MQEYRKIAQLDASFCQNEIESLDGLIRDTINFIQSRQLQKRNITEYETGSCFHTQAYMDLKGMKEACEKYYDENGKEIEEAIQKQWELSANLESSILKSKQTEEIVEGVASAGISIMPVLGDIKDAQEAVTGVDFVTGERLTKVERGISFACMLIPIVNGKMIIKGGKKLVRIGSEVPGSVIKVSNVVTKNTAKYKVYLRKVWIDEKESINKFIGEAKDTVRKIKNGEPYAYEYVTPEGYRAKVSDLDDVPKNGAVYHKSVSESGIKSIDSTAITHSSVGILHMTPRQVQYPK